MTKADTMTKERVHAGGVVFRKKGTAQFPFLRNKVGLRHNHTVFTSLCPLFNLPSQLADLYEIWNKRNSIGGHPKVLLCTFLYHQ